MFRNTKAGSKQDEAIVIATFFFFHLVIDVCAITKNLFHNDFEGFIQEELSLSIINKRLTQVLNAG